MAGVEIRKLVAPHPLAGEVVRPVSYCSVIIISMTIIAWRFWGSVINNLLRRYTKMVSRNLVTTGLDLLP
jgi:hypothetical protein